MHESFYGAAYLIDISGGDDLSFYQRSGASGFHCANANSSNAAITNYWKVLYVGIMRANVLLENADKSTEINEKVRNEVKAQALFLRSFYYYNLVQGWGDVPFRLSSAQSVDGLSMERTNKDTIYDHIIADIISIIPNLPRFGPTGKVTCPGYVTQSAAKGILARIYLFRAGEHYRDELPGDPVKIASYFANAKRWAVEVKDSAVNIGIHGLVSPYSRVFTDLSEDKYNSTGTVESIWEAEEAGNRTTTESSAGRIGSSIGFGCTYDYSTNAKFQNSLGMANPGYSYRFIYASLKLYEMYDSEGDTARGNWNIANYEYVVGTDVDKTISGRLYFKGKAPKGMTLPAVVGGFNYNIATAEPPKTRCSAKYRREYEKLAPKNKNFTPENIPILRYSDILLMIAEAENELNGPTGLAYECINEVRTRANLSLLSGLTADTFREAIKKERAMEFCFEAIRRWDLIRWGDYLTAMQGMQGYVDSPDWSNNYKYAATYYKVSKSYNYLPIPVAEMTSNKAISQNNPGW